VAEPVKQGQVNTAQLVPQKKVKQRQASMAEPIMQYQANTVE